MLSLKRVIVTGGLVSLALVPGAPIEDVHAASYLVTTLADSGPGSLRQGILDANATAGADTITFGASGTIVLATSLPDITDSAGLIIDGSGQAVVVSGNNAVRPFYVMPEGRLELHGLTISQGLAQGGFNCDPFFCVPFTGQGGGVLNRGTLVVSRSSLVGNRAEGCAYCGPYGEGGGIYSANSHLMVMDSTISNNLGGGIATHGAAGMSLTNTTISNNIGDVGAGISSSGASGRHTITNSTISGNAARVGGGLYTSSESVYMGLTNSLVSGNTATSLGADCASGRIWALGPNFIGDPVDCTIAGLPPVTGDPKLGPLADNGGPTQTHALLPGSPAIDAGDDAVCAAAPVSGKDQRGVTRPLLAHCDLGAFEFGFRGPVVGGKNLRITTGSIDLSWDGGTAQTGYTLLQFNAITSSSTFIPLPANATSYSDAAAVPGGLYCYALAAMGAGDVVLGLSDLECAISGVETGAVAPVGFALTLNQTATATLTWIAPAGGADAYLLQRLPLDGSPPTQGMLPGSGTSSSQAVPASGACFQLVAYQGDAWGSSDALCGIPGFTTLGKPASGKLQTVGEALTAVERRLADLAQAKEAFRRVPE